MAWLSVTRKGKEYITDYTPFRSKIKVMVEDGEEEDYHGHFFKTYRHNGEYEDVWCYEENNYWKEHKAVVKLPKGTIKKLIGRELTWEDEPVELKEGK